jgi:PKD repeat protein
MFQSFEHHFREPCGILTTLRAARARRCFRPRLEALEDRLAPATWNTLASMPTARFSLAATTGSDGRTYAIGGITTSAIVDVVEAYDPIQNAWGVAPRISTPRFDLAAVTGSDGRVYAIGGAGPSGILNTVEAYNPSTNTWTAVASMHTARFSLAAATGSDGRIYAIGGAGPSGTLNSVEAYSPGTNTWTAVASMPTPRYGLATAPGPDGRIYVIGGTRDGAHPLDTVEAYNPATDTWATVANMPTARIGLGAATGPDGLIYAIGGTNTIVPLNTVEAYSTISNTWTAVVSMPTARADLGVADGPVYAIGGTPNGLDPLNTVEALTVPVGGGPPVVTPPGNQIASEGTVQSFPMGSFTADGNHAWLLGTNWGDGTPDTTFNMPVQGTIPNQTHDYAEEGTFTVTITVTDTITNLAGSATFMVTVSDAPLTAGALTPPVATEGQALINIVLFHFTDANPNGTATDFKATVTWGDGAVEDSIANSTDVQVAASPGGGWDLRGSHTYQEEQVKLLYKVVVQDLGGAPAISSSASINVSDPPVSGLPVSVTAAIGSAFSGPVATFTDPGGVEPNAFEDPGGSLSNHYSASINWGDGTAATVGTITLSGTTFTVNGTHTYTTPGTFTITATISHEGSPPAVVKITVATGAAPPPVVTPPPNQTASEGALRSATLGSFSDQGPGGWTAMVLWGDGASTPFSAGPPGSLGSQPHTYAEEGSYAVTITVTDTGDTESGSATFMVTVSDPSVVAMGLPVSGTINTPINAAVATFSDPGGAEVVGNYAATINWGDGTATSTGVISQNGGTFTVSGSHTYSTANSYTITATINHDAAPPVTVTSTATITGATPPVVSPPPTQSAAEGLAQSLNLGSFTDQDGGPWSVDISWGDGTHTTFTQIAVGSLGSKPHTYGEEGSYTVTVAVTDTLDNQSGSGKFQVSVADPNVVASGSTITATAGAPFSNTAVATFTDPGDAEPNPADPAGTINDHYAIVSINWGDGTPLDTTSGKLSFSGSPGSKTDKFTVTASHTYAASGSYMVTVAINHEGVMSNLTQAANVSSLGLMFQGSQTRTSGFWNDGNLGQELLRKFTKTAAGQTLGQWLDDPGDGV